MFKYILVIAMAFITGSANAYVLTTPSYSYPNNGQRYNIKNQLHHFINDLTFNSPCNVNIEFVNEAFVQFDRNVLTDITVMNKGKHVYYERYDITRESYVSDMNQLRVEIEKRCSK